LLVTLASYYLFPAQDSNRSSSNQSVVFTKQ
jgi:hypothetical protein